MAVFDITAFPIDYMLIGLAAECPFGGNPADCQLHALRKKPMAERVNYVRSLSLAEKKEIIARHQECFARKTAQG